MHAKGFSLELLFNLIHEIMVNFFKGIIFFLLLQANCYSQTKSDSLSIFFHENEILISKVRLIAFNKNTDSIKISDIEGGVIFKENLDFKNNIYFFEAGCHLIKFPEINYLEKVNYFDIYYYSKKAENKFIKIYGEHFYQAGKENYYFRFGLGEILLISMDKSKIRKNKRMVKRAKVLN
ncbi:MAG: hypothetical protein ACK4M1_07055 [Flavobacterium sp.]